MWVNEMERLGKRQSHTQVLYRVGKLHHLGLAGGQIAGCATRAGIQGHGAVSATIEPSLERFKLLVHFRCPTRLLG